MVRILPMEIKLTNARKELLEILQKSAKPLSFEDIRHDISMDKATFYRNITIFEKEGIVDSFESNDKKRYYELHDTPHAHFVCVACNAIECLESLPHISLENHTIENIIIKGKCPRCIGME